MSGHAGERKDFFYKLCIISQKRPMWKICSIVPCGFRPGLVRPLDTLIDLETV